MIRILIADDHSVVREGLKRIIGSVRDMKVAGEAENAGEVFERIRTAGCDVVILDISMLGGDGLDVLKTLKEENPGVPVLIFSVHSEEKFAVPALRAGADGYLTKDCPPGNILTAIRRVHGGGKYISPSVAERLAVELRHGPENPHETLSCRELQVMSLIGRGLTVTAVARELSISVKTVSTYRSRILEKLQLKSSAEIIFYAIRNELVF
ncbi:MAG: response regulator transcription factor [bacterium]